MNGFDRLKEQVKDQEDIALKETVEYLLTRNDMEPKYLNEEKSVDEMAKYIRNKGLKHSKNGWNYIPNNVVFSWAIAYFSLPNEFLKIEKEVIKNKDSKKEIVKNNVISIEEVKRQVEKKKEIEQISLFGGTT